MFLKKGGVTIEVFHPSEIARYKQLGYKEPEKEPKPVAPVASVAPVVNPEAKPDQQAADQTTVEETLQPAKKGKGKS